MAETEGPNGTSIDLRHDNENDAGAQVDASLLRLAATFGVVSFPPGMPDYLQAAILEKAEQDRNADGSFIAGSAENADERRREDKRQAQDNMSRWADALLEEREERERWARTQSIIGGVTKTGAEWQSFAKRLREDDELRQRIIEAFRKRGMTEDEAEQRYERVVDIAEIAAIPPSQRTEEQQQEFEKAKADPTFQQDMQEANAAASVDRRVGATLRSEQLTADTPTAAQPERKIEQLAGPGF